MNLPTRATQPLYDLLPAQMEGFEPLAELALDMRWSLFSRSPASCVVTCTARPRLRHARQNTIRRA
jgi:hypothetical protein